MRAALIELREVATRAELNSALPAIEAALAGEAAVRDRARRPLTSRSSSTARKRGDRRRSPLSRPGRALSYSVTSLAAAAAVAAST